MLAFIQNTSNQRKIAVALAAFLALFSSKVPFLADINPDQIMWLIGAIAVWIGQSGLKAAAQAQADGNANAALITTAKDAVAVFNQIAADPKNSLTPVVVPAPAPPLTAPAVVK